MRLVWKCELLRLSFSTTTNVYSSSLRSSSILTSRNPSFEVASTGCCVSLFVALFLPSTFELSTHFGAGI